ncbi:hypothetical protein D3C72_1996610 [compost metagenome]
MSHHQWYHTYNKGQRSHDDGAQTGFGRIQCSIYNRQACPATLYAKLYNKNGILGQQADQHDEPYLYINIIVQTNRTDTQEGT